MSSASKGTTAFNLGIMAMLFSLFDLIGIIGGDLMGLSLFSMILGTVGVFMGRSALMTNTDPLARNRLVVSLAVAGLSLVIATVMFAVFFFTYIDGQGYMRPDEFRIRR